MIFSSKKKRMRKRWLLLSVIGILVCAAAAAVVLLPRGTGAFQEEIAESGDIVTYHNFTGTVDTRNRETIISEKPMQICEIKVNQGDQIKSGDILMITSEGEEIKASIDGEVSQILIKKDAQVPAGIELIKLVDYVNLETNIKIDEYSIKFIENDQEVDVAINALGIDLSGTVSAISKEAKSENGMSYFTATIDLEKDEDLRIGMSTEAKIIKEKAIAVTTLPMDVVLFDNDNQPYVLMPSEEGEPLKQSITTGINDGMFVEVKKGVSVGDSVMHETGDEGLLEQLFWRR